MCSGIHERLLRHTGCDDDDNEDEDEPACRWLAGKQEEKSIEPECQPAFRAKQRIALLST